MHTHHSALVAALTGDPSPALSRPGSASEARTLLAAAEGQGVRPLLVEVLLAHGSQTLDGALRSSLTDRALRETAHAVLRQRELGRCIAALSAAGVPAVVFKGAATCRWLFTRPQLRPMDDTDLLLDRRYRHLAGAVLEDVGYARVPGNDRDLAMAQTLFRRRDPHGVLHNLDVHWRISNRPPPPHGHDLFSPRALRARAVSLPGLGDGALQPDAVDSLIIACTHLAAHHAGALRLIWLYEIRLMLERLQRDDHAVVRERVRCAGLMRPFSAGLASALDVFPIPLPQLQDLCHSGDDLSRARPPLVHWLQDLATLPGFRARMDFLMAHAFPAAAFMRSRPQDAHRPLAWLYLRRALRGARHLLPSQTAPARRRTRL